MSARLVEISDSNSGEDFCLDLLVDEATFGGSSIERGGECHHVGDAIGVLATTSEGDEDLTVVVGGQCFDCGRSEFVDHDNKKAIECDVF